MEMRARGSGWRRGGPTVRGRRAPHERSRFWEVLTFGWNDGFGCLSWMVQGKSVTVYGMRLIICSRMIRQILPRKSGTVPILEMFCGTLR
jgi:hypothetical protein